MNISIGLVLNWFLLCFGDLFPKFFLFMTDLTTLEELPNVAHLRVKIRCPIEVHAGNSCREDIA